MPIAAFIPKDEEDVTPPAETPVLDGVETTFTWANLMREAKMPSGIDVGMGVAPSPVPSQRGSLY